MRLPGPLVPARLVRRYKRFLADVILDDGGEAIVHCPNPGAMTGLALPDMRIWLTDHAGSKRKLRYGWELSETPTGLVGINTARPNQIAADALGGGTVPELAGYQAVDREVPWGEGNRLDFRLRGAGRPDCFVEVKNVHLERSGAVPGLAEFPDCVTARGARHMRVLADIVRAGGRAVLLYIVQRTDCDRMGVAGDIDPAYALSLARGLTGGVEVLCYDCSISREHIDLRRRLPILGIPVPDPRPMAGLRIPG